MGAARRRRPPRRGSARGRPARAARGGRLPSPSNAYLDEIAYCYAAHDLVVDPLPADADEFFEGRVVPYPEAVRMALDGEITESVSKVTILQYAARTLEGS